MKFRIQFSIHEIVMIDDEVAVVSREPVKGETKMETHEVSNGVHNVDMSDAKAAPEAPTAAEVSNGSLVLSSRVRGTWHQLKLMPRLTRHRQIRMQRFGSHQFSNSGYSLSMVSLVEVSFLTFNQSSLVHQMCCCFL